MQIRKRYIGYALFLLSALVLYLFVPSFTTQSQRIPEINFKYTSVQTETIPVYCNNVSVSTLSLASDQMNLVPGIILSKFQDEGWTFIVDDNLISDDAIGATCRADKTCAIRNTETAATDASLHELGHYVDMRQSALSYLSSREDFMELYQNYCSLFCEHYQYYRDDMNPKELFAEAFQQYCSDSEFATYFRELQWYFNQVIHEMTL